MMLAAQFFIHITRDTPADAELVSHRLMLRAGFIRKLASGIYSWLPAGWRVVRKITDIVREEMDAAGCAEIFMPAVQPAELWQESGRWREYGPELLRFADRHRRDFCMGPTHEEVVTDIVRASVSSYRQLPFNLYQIQTKFRDEIRPRFGVMRAREFIMKDAYSFDIDDSGMQKSYEKMRDAYCNIFNRIGLQYRMVEAESGTIGGDYSHEFMVLADSGEEVILYSADGNFAANVARAPCPPPAPPTVLAAMKPMQKIRTPNVKTIDDLARFLGGDIPPQRNIKTMIVRGDDGIAAVLLQGNHALNLTKAARQKEIGKNATLASLAETEKLIGAGFGSLGPVQMPLPVVADFALTHCINFVCGANENDYHFCDANFGRDCAPRFADLRNAVAGDTAPGGGVLSACRGIEVGHIFQLGDKYSRALNALVDETSGGAKPILMGCYGIGITRIVAAAIEQGHDDKGIIFPDAIAPFAAVVAPIGWNKSPAVQSAAKKIYEELLAAGVDVLLDDRDLRAGAMFAELDLLGIPHRIVIGEKGLAKNEAEYKHRGAQKAENYALGEIVGVVVKKQQCAKIV